MKSGARFFLIAAALALAAGLLWVLWVRSVNRPPSPVADTQARNNGRPVVVQDLQPVEDALDTNRLVLLTHDQVLASVNGRDIKPGDLYPVRGTNAQQLARGAYEYLLQRAIDRELILQTAKARGLELSQAQKRQLAEAKAARQLPEPGQVQRMNVDQAQLDFEMRDGEAFLLQTSLMAGSGATPNVTAEQVAAYYDSHASEFGALPTEEEPRREAWKKIDIDIRQKLVAPARTAYQEHLASFMKQLKADADIRVTELPDAGR